MQNAVTVDSGKITKSFMHGLAERGGEISFPKFPFKLVFIPSGDGLSIVYALLACGEKPRDFRLFPAAPRPKKILPKSVFVGTEIL